MSKKHRRTRRDRRRRALSQNFLVDDRVIERVVATADVGPDDLVVDLGAGRGALALPIARTGAQVIAVELDPAWIEELRAAAAGTDNLTPVHADIRDVELPDTPFRVVASPPYNMSTVLVRRLLTLNRPLRDATLVLQKQTARRLASDGRVGRFSLTWIPWFDLQVRGHIPRSAFRPVPSSDSALLTVRPRDVAWLSPARFSDWTVFVDGLFETHGRTLADRWRSRYGRRGLDTAHGATDVDLRRPPSRVHAQEWVTLFRTVTRETAER